MLRLRMKSAEDLGCDKTATAAMVAHAGKHVDVSFPARIPNVEGSLMASVIERAEEARRLLCNGEEVPSLMGSAALFENGLCSPPSIFASFTFDDDTEPKVFVNLSALDRYVCPPKSGPWAAALLMMSAANPS